MNSKKIILVAGGTASGKTMIAENLKKAFELNDKTATLISIDNYYYSINDLPEKSGKEVNWDSPKVINWKQLINDLKRLKNGEDIVKEKYNFSIYSHKGEVNYTSNDYLIVEGLFALYHDQIRDLADSLIFVEADDDIRLIRRIKRDSNGRYKDSFNIDEFFNKWTNEIKPMHNRFILPTRAYAGFTIRNNEEYIGKEKERMTNLLQSLVVKY